jgi:ATP-dependent DNA ligase
MFKKEIHGLRYSEHVTGDGPGFRVQACRLGLEGVISKQADRPYAPGDRGIWVKSKRSSLLSAGPILRAVDRTLAPYCSAITPRMDGCTTPAVQAPA